MITQNKEGYMQALITSLNKLEIEIYELLEIQFPDNWDVAPDYESLKLGQNYYEKDLDSHPFLVPIKRTSDEYKDVCNQLRNTNSKELYSATCRSIHRVVNPFLWSLYYCKVQELNYMIFKKLHFRNKGKLCRTKIYRNGKNVMVRK
jgi:hypothetical protein